MRSESKVDLDSLIADSLAVVREAPSRAGRIVALQTMGVKHVFFVDTERVADFYRGSISRVRPRMLPEENPGVPPEPVLGLSKGLAFFETWDPTAANARGFTRPLSDPKRLFVTNTMWQPSQTSIFKRARMRS
jgi:hypothetical protein